MTRKTITKKDAELFHSWLKKDRETIKNISSEIKKFTRISCMTNPAHRITKDFYRFIDEDILDTLSEYRDAMAALSLVGPTTIDGENYDRLETLLNAHIKLTGYASVMTASFSDMLSELDTLDEEEARPYINATDELTRVLEDLNNNAFDTALTLFDPDRL